MTIWKKTLSLSELNHFCRQSAVSHLGIEFCAQGKEWLEASLEVNSTTIQPMGALHGGISVALAETVASMAAFCTLAENEIPVGIEINASHLRPVRQGKVIAKATPIRLGKTMQVWHIDIRDQQQQSCCICRLTLSVLQN